jgi:type VI secretion system secreted protein VgrG
VTRAGKGLVITTEQLADTHSPIKAMGSTIDRIETSRKLHESLASQALRYRAHEDGQQETVVDALRIQHCEIAGSDERLSELTSPHVVISSSAGLEISTAESTHISSKEHIAITPGRNLSIAAGESMFASIKRMFCLFVEQAGMKLIAAAGKVTISAQQDDIDIIAKKVLSLISQTDWIELKAKKGIRLHGSDSMLEISDIVQFFTAKPVLFRGNLETLPASGRPHPNHPTKNSEIPPRAPRGMFDERFHLVSHDGETPLAHRRYRITADDGQYWEGMTNGEGLTERVYTTSKQKLTLEIF